ncbi:hypothetical protein [Nocardioides perillae]|uniref:Uncharacterized protein n=1 Tax=Nocardioides perillae TaxID=1119534 RepID=A0A7Y9RQP2_9ACTN|nr:hypothetical protein [Nocardioides perillae]NYG54535.1 hypothetical protein [Nocardioides perillae]
MSSKDAPARPPQASAAGWALVVGGAFVVLSAFESVSSLRSLESREQVEEMLAEPPASGLGLGVEGVLDLMHALTLVTGACAAAIAVLGWQVLQRNRQARVAVSALAVPLLIAGTVVGGLVAVVVATAAALLWVQPTRAWFDGVEAPPRRGLEPPRRRPPHPLPRQEARPGATTDGPADRGTPADPGAPAAEQRPLAPVGAPGPGESAAGGPRAYDGFGSVRASAPVDHGAAHPGPHPGPAGPSGQQQPWGAPYAPWPGRDEPRRPAAVTVACVLTWVTTAVVGLLTGISLVALALAPDLLVESALEQQPGLLDGGVSREQLLSGLWVLGGLTVAWCVAAAVVAGFAFRGDRWARGALLASAVLATVLSLLSSPGAPAMVVPMLAGSVVVACLLRSESRAFFRRDVVR